MKRILFIAAVLAVVASLGAAPAYAASCDELIAQAEQRIAASSDPAQRADAEGVLQLAIQLRTDGEGDHCAYIAENVVKMFK